MKDLHHAAIVEQIFLRNHPFQSTRTKKPVGHGNRKTHQYSKSVVSVYGAASRVPIHVTGDGNCLFNSVSVVVQGNEALASELRVQTCIELVLNFAYYKNHSLYQDFRLVLPDLVRACQMCATDYEFSSIFTVQGLSSVIGREIVSVYPAINGMLDQCVRILNTIVSPRIQTQRHRCRDRVYVMWTQIGGCFPQPQGKTWLPDHFVPLIGNDQIPSGRKTSSPIDVDIPSPNFIEDIPSPVKKSGKRSSPPTTPPSSCEDCSLLSGSEMQGEPENISVPQSNTQSSETPTTPPENISVPQSDTQSSETPTTTPENISVIQSDTQSSETPTTPPTDSKQDGVANKNKLSGRFLDVEELSDILQGDSVSSSLIPNGVKENTYFLIKNDKNVEKRKQGKRSKQL